MTREEVSFRLREIADALDTDPEMQEGGVVAVVASSPGRIMQVRFVGSKVDLVDFFMVIGAVSVTRDALSNDLHHADVGSDDIPAPLPPQQVE